MQNPTPLPQRHTYDADTTSRHTIDSEQPLVLGRYRIVETRGSGGFGVVHVCWDTRLQRRVAIKQMPLDPITQESTTTLHEALDEARITSQLTHPSIVIVHDFEVTRSAAYLIMEYVDGLTLAELCARVEDGVLTYDECAHVFSSLANALAYAHEHGVLHLDIKPSNIFIDADGTVKLGDFGMASLASAAGWQGARGGTIGYMPPEQLTGGLVDERTDVFALAVVCYQALTGISPFSAPTAKASRKNIERGAKPLAKIEPELSGPVSDTIARALSAEPAARPGTIGSFADALAPYIGDESAGRASIAQLIRQTEGENGPDEQAWEQAAHVRLIERWPWLARACTHATAALSSGLIAFRVAPSVLYASGFVPTGEPFIISCFVMTGISALLPRVGGLATCALIVVAILAQGLYSPAFLIALLMAAVMIAWYLHCAALSRLSTTALLLPAALGAPTAACALAGHTLSPLNALMTAPLGIGIEIITRLIQLASQQSPFLVLCSTAITNPQTWSIIILISASTWLCACIGYKRRRCVQIMAQLISTAVIIAGYLTIPGMEKAGLWSDAMAYSIAIAVVCAVLMSTATVLLGSAPKLRGDE